MNPNSESCNLPEKVQESLRGMKAEETKQKKGQYGSAKLGGAAISRRDYTSYKESIHQNHKT